MGLRLPWRARSVRDADLTDHAVLFGEVVGVQVPPGFDVSVVIDDITRDATRYLLGRIDDLRAHGRWTEELERRYDAVSRLRGDADPKVADAASRALVSEIARVEREHAK